MWALSPNTRVLVFSRFIARLLLSSFSVCVVSSKLCSSVSMRSMASANARLFILVALIITPPSPLSLILSNILSSTRMKVFGDTGSLCLVPLFCCEPFSQFVPNSHHCRSVSIDFPCPLVHTIRFIRRPSYVLINTFKSFGEVHITIENLDDFLLAFSPISLPCTYNNYGPTYFCMDDKYKYPKHNFAVH